MLAVAGILAFGAVIVWMEVPDLLKNKRKKDFWVFSVPLSDFIFGLLESSD
ncbi:hypothetical protein NLX71_23435 [Paenibacillus sp. MZ04-78.2]|uniref:hypothetical protein n=1 Tax=Paenibacillus sp. MZ04-78.2 TaxID=2962034 RepID=UPI0020B8894D|nr:hypothetical protein [Paenibacillus sp. MZ04-78.2]MCP3776214.1 hypothetical protein [Paenibacillus sp. MZ04-78.2]